MAPFHPFLNVKVTFLALSSIFFLLQTHHRQLILSKFVLILLHLLDYLELRRSKWLLLVLPLLELPLFLPNPLIAHQLLLDTKHLQSPLIVVHDPVDQLLRLALLLHH